jgi:hypothetical protein
MGEVKLVYQRTQAAGVDAAAGRNQAGADFYDEAHTNSNSLTANLPCLAFFAGDDSGSENRKKVRRGGR